MPTSVNLFDQLFDLVLKAKKSVKHTSERLKTGFESFEDKTDNFLAARQEEMDQTWRKIEKTINNK